MAKKIDPLIKWPDRDTLYKTMPLAFWKLEMPVIIDCSEIFIEQPSDLLARAQVWSKLQTPFYLEVPYRDNTTGTIS